jgi:hypothetical protein
VKAEIFVVNIDNYFPELCEISLPTIDAYAKKIGGKMTIISSREYTREHYGFPVTVEKLQAVKSEADYVLIVDADMIIHPDFWDITRIISSTTIGAWMSYDAKNLFGEHEYFDRFGQYRGIATNFLVVPQIWKNDILSFDRQEALAGFKTIKRSFILDEYIVSLHAAKYGARLGGIITENNANQIKHINVTTDNKGKETAIKEAQKYVDLWTRKGKYPWTK